MDVSDGGTTSHTASVTSLEPVTHSNNQQPPPKDDPRVDFIRRLVLRTFPAVKIDKLHKLFASDAVAPLLFDFLHVPDARLLLVTDHGSEFSGNIMVYATPPAQLFGPSPVLTTPMCVLYLAKSVKAAVSLDKCHEEILSGTMERNALDSLALIMQEIYLPLVGNPRNQRLWPEMVTTSVLNNVHGFFSSLQITAGQTRGATCLPLPWDQVLTENTHGKGNNGATLTMLVKDQVHSLEGCLITWTKQIKNILKQDPESLLNKKHNMHPGPMEELAFWAAKARNLNSIFAQLQSDSIRKVLQYLDASKSTYNVPFAKLCKEVFLARAEANDNLHFLQPLTKWFEQLINAPTFAEIRDIFRPICHSILLVWKCSRFYNTPTRLVVLVRQICNEIIRKASTQYLNGKILFDLIEQNELEQANEMLLLCLQVCAHFKSVYFDYKAKSVVEVPGNPWRIQNNALFIRLDAFLERCHDVLELTQTIYQFQKLSSMEIGGTKGKTLTTSVHQIHNDFQETLAQMKNVHYDLMDLDAKHFEDDFYTFRSKNKELERRLASVINQAFDDAKTITGRFKCLDCFEDLLDRQIIKNELERKYTALIASYATDLHVVQQIFIENRDEPPVPPNLPPFAGAVTWCHGLAERIKFPMEKLKKISPRLVLEREDSKEAIQLYTNVMAMLQEYEVQTVKKWGVSIETSSKAKLKLPLIRRDNISGTNGAGGGGSVLLTTNIVEMAVAAASTGASAAVQASQGILFVNFDPALVQLLREVKYFVLLGVEIPEDALAIYKRAEVFRRQTGNLELIVDLYNNIHATLLPVERPLVKNYLDRMDQALNKGIKALNWKSHGIDVFLKESMTDVNEANTLLSQLKAHQARVNELLELWNTPPLLFERKSKPLTITEFEELQKGLCQHKYNTIKEGGNEIHRLLKDSLKYLRVSQGSPDWRAYVDYVSAMVEDGLTRVVLASLKHLRDQLDPKRIEHDDLSALVEVELDLYGKDIVYFPTIASTATRNGLRDVVVRRIEAILHCSTVFKRLDSSEGTYLKEMRENVQVQQLVADISGFLDQNEKAAAAFRVDLTKYEYLWTTDLPQMFTSFLTTAWHPPQVTATTDQASSYVMQYADQYPMPIATTCSFKGLTTKAPAAPATTTVSIPSSNSATPLPPMPAQLLDLRAFEEKIHFFLALQNEISESKHVKDVGFVRVNSLPIKQALSTWVTKWIYMFTQYLHDRVVNQLLWLDQFMARVNIGLEQELSESASDSKLETDKEKSALMQCMHFIRDVRRLMREDILVNFSPLREIVMVLKQNGIALDMSYVGKDNVLVFLEQAPFRWENMVNKTFKKKEVIQPLQSQMVESIRNEIADFHRRLLVLKDDFHTAAPFAAPVATATVNVEEAYANLDAYNLKLVTFEQEAARLIELEDMFELAPSKNDILAVVRRDLVLLKQVWDLVSLQDAVYLRWQQLVWMELQTDALMDEADALERLRKTLPLSRVKEWPIYQFLAQKAHQMVTVLPLVKHLHSPVMRERHWKSIMVLTRKHFDLSSIQATPSGGSIGMTSSGSGGNNVLRLEEVLKLELHRFVNEVNELVEVASREFKIEQQLQAIETTWNTLTLEFVPYKTALAKTSVANSRGPPANKAKQGMKKLQEEEDDVEDDELDHPDTSGGDLLVLKPPNAVLECLEDHQLQLQTMASMGKFVAYFKDKVFEWQLRLGNVDVILKLWITLQRQWCSLEAIFLSAAGDIQSQLPQEFKRFQHVDEEIKELFHDAVAFPSILTACCHREGREVVLRDLHSELEVCQKALNQYLDGKKDVFPRFYFISNASLLEMLSNGNHPPRLQPHFGHCFDGIQSFEFESLPPTAVSTEKRRVSVALASSSSGASLERYLTMAMISKEGEVVRFLDSHLIHGAVENWLNDLVQVMQQTLREQLLTALDASALWGVEVSRHAWVFDYAAQVALVASQLVWTEEVEAALEELENGNEEALKKFVDVSSVRLEELIKLVQGSLSALDRQKIITLITIDVHARDVIQSLIAKKVTSSLDFAWQSQLRYYPTQVPCGGGMMRRDVNIRICDFRAFYAYEYTGNSGRLVITPLTDRCYVTLTTALRLCLGGAPAGPAGTGKTETTKDLARGLGLQCYVFNCSDQMNYKTMADIFQGLAQTGAWGCFDEFNRISVEVLSVVATQVKTVLDATAPLATLLHRLAVASSAGTSGTNGAGAGADGSHTTSTAALTPVSASLPISGSCDFFGKTINLLPTVGFFITMNPGYAGRAELPENLKALFRSCAMIKPDLQPICENMLMAEGFLKARALSIKFVTLYELSQELLSKQKHYDWGLRAVKSVLLVAGALRRAQATDTEDLVLMQVLRDFNTPKLLPADAPVFLGLLNDLFPNQTLVKRVNVTLKTRCLSVCKTLMLQPEEGFVRKVLEYDDVLQVRHSVMLIGPAGCGKTAIWTTLAACHNAEQPKPVIVYETVNPKAISADELYGVMTLEKDWKDGVVSAIMRDMAKNNAPYSAVQTAQWLVLDGDIDAGWIESMNTVMDDNKVLTLVSNERIPLTKPMRLVFEIHSLLHATPATVSRAGIIYIHAQEIGWLPFVESWLQRRTHQSANEASFLPSLVLKHVEPLLLALGEQKLSSIVPLSQLAMVMTLCHLLDGMLAQVTESEKTAEWMENAFFYCVLWAFGGALDSEKASTDPRTVFSSQLKSIFKFKPADSGSSASASSSLTSLSAFEICFDVKKNEFCAWQERVPALVAIGDVPFHQLLVPTVESTRLHAMLDLLVPHAVPVMLVGASGTGKTAIVMEHLRNATDRDGDDACKTATVTMHHFMDAQLLQQRLEKYVEKRSGRVYGPLQNKKLVYFLDDLNLASVEPYGTQTAMALLRQFMDYNAWYDRQDLSIKKTIQDVQFMACMNAKAGSFTVNPRLQRHFATFAVHMPSKGDLTTIYLTLLTQHVQNFADKLKKLVPPIIQATLDLYQDVKRQFVPCATKFHYVFSLRELSAIFQGLTLTRADAFPSSAASTIKFTRVWLHECVRVFSDRMASASETQRFMEMVLEHTKKYFEDDPGDLFATPLICAGFLNPNQHSDEGSSSSSSSPQYLPITDKTQLTKAIELQLRSYNEAHPVMHLVLFGQALEHIARLTRILTHPRGHALLIGVGGSGKQSLSRLAAFICHQPVQQLSITASPHYGLVEFREDLKEIYRKAGVRPALPLVLLLTDAQLTNERFLVLINDILSTGVIPDLFSPEELDAMLGSLRNDAKLKGIPDTKEHLTEFFYERVRWNLHVILACSPVGPTLRLRCRHFPALFTNCTMDWFHPWPKEALIDVSMQFLQDVSLASPAIQENVCHHMAEMHLSVIHASVQYEKQYGRYNYVTPTSFLELIRFYRRLLTAKRTTQQQKIQRLAVGLATLKKTASHVAELQEELKKTMKKVDERKKATDMLLEQMGKQRGDAELKQKRADEERAKAAKAAETAANIESQASVELAISRPALEAAQQAVNCLNKASLTELKSMGKPPPGVDKVTAAVLMLVKQETKNLSWDNAKKMMAKVDVFKQSLEQFDKENIPPDVIMRVEPILEDPNFNYEKMKSKSVAAANLCVWVINIVAFHHVYTRVKPLMDTLEEARRAKSEADSELATVQALVAQVEAQLSALQASFRDATNEKAKVEAEAAACQERLSLAERLVHGLASENERWSKEIDVLRAGETALIGDTLLAAGFVSYIDIITREIPISIGGSSGDRGGSDGVNGEDSNDSGRRTPSDERRGDSDHDGGDGGGGSGSGSSESVASGVDPVEMLSDGSAVAQWMNEGLPADRISIENGCIITACERWPLLVDPQLQGLTWLRSRDFSAANTATDTSASTEPAGSNRRSNQETAATTTTAAPPRRSIAPGASVRGLTRRASNRSVDSNHTESATQTPVQSPREEPARASSTSSKHTEVSPLVILHTSQKVWIKSLKTAISSGQSVILENLGETLDATLEPVLMRQVYRKGRNWFLHFAAEEVEFDPKFRLFLHTKLPNPHYRPEILAYCTLIDFSVTEKGLEDQLLANVVNLEQPILEKQKQRLQQEFNGYQIQLLQLENQLLERLSNAPDDILSDVPLIEGLEKTKLTANEVALALLKGKEAEKEINLAREVYRPVANEASLLYFLMSQLCKVNHMYRYSLESFMTFFYVALHKIPASSGSIDEMSEVSNTEGGGFLSSSSYSTAFERVPQLKDALRWTLFVMVTRGLFEEHKLIFLTQLVLLLLRRGVLSAQNSGYSEETAWFLLQGPKAVGPENTIPWLTETQWQALQALITLEPFERFVADLEESEARFREWYNSPCPEVEKLPLDWRDLDKTAPFLKLLVVRCMRPDRLSQGISQFIAATLPNGRQYLTCDAQLNSYAVLTSAFEESTPWTPMYFILSPGTDVVADVDRLAVVEYERIKGVDYHNIALGQGQEAIAMQKLQLSVENGHWIILNNVHLMPTWLVELDKWLEQLAKASKTASYATLTMNLSTAAGNKGRARSSVVANAGGLHPNFRLFITSDPSPNIPIGVLERSIKLTNEPPSGLKANVKRAFCCFAQPQVDELEPRTRVILFAMCYFHSLMLERKRFGAQGFNMIYPFAASDLVSSSIVLRNYMENVPARVPWADLRYLFGEIMYGGHIVNERDRLVAMTYLGYFLRDELLEELSMVPYGEELSGGGKTDGASSAAGDAGGEDGISSGGGGGGLQRRDFLAPKLSMGFDRILDHIETTLVNDSPTAFGMHPNAEVAFRTEHGDRLVQTILVLSKRDDQVSGKENADSAQMVAEGVLQDILENYREFRFDIQDLFFKSMDTTSASNGKSSGKAGRSGSSGSAALAGSAAALEEMDPFQTVLLQECERMNVLLDVMTKSLVELEMGFRGDVTLTESMEALQDALYYEKIPKQWEAVAFPSRRSLAPWLSNLQQRIAQLQDWNSQAPELPVVLWLPGLFNPQSFLTAVLQTSARKNGLELDKLSVLTDITKRSLESIDAPSRDGQYVHGLILEGARWELGNGMLESSLPKEMHVNMPVINIRAVLTARKEQTTGSIYECPVYKTQQRGPTFVFTAQLRTKHPPSKWILAGVALLLEVV
ncbi:hypothetical protein Poli38472_011802 [Pythium oligandrum]|uniref:AAA+ ATPase domain-containing protein n=1 Tax=Pythium oligandrum TaxID=41045 RepID=A0A8K1FER1_PYTOL|nr:hypothetical protein Poli38472_011802 [Pythium oligandrum]|eukprot:TMW58214.1 hypothetical protein Poli38472_011802 [Pythium oligandrum]